MSDLNPQYASASRKHYSWRLSEMWEDDNFSYFFTESQASPHPIFSTLPYRRVGKDSRKTLPRACYLLFDTHQTKCLSWAVALGFAQAFRTFHVLVGSWDSDVSSDEALALLAGSLFCYSDADLIYFYPAKPSCELMLAGCPAFKKESFHRLDMNMRSDAALISDSRFLLDHENWEKWPLADEVTKDLSYLVRAKANRERKAKKRPFLKGRC